MFSDLCLFLVNCPGFDEGIKAILKRNEIKIISELSSLASHLSLNQRNCLQRHQTILLSLYILHPRDLTPDPIQQDFRLSQSKHRRGVIIYAVAGRFQQRHLFNYYEVSIATAPTNYT